MGTTDQLGNINLWLGVLAIASVVQVLALVTLAVLGARLYAQAMRALADLERRHVEPLARRTHEVLDDVSAQVARVRQVGDGIGQAAGAVKSTVMPGWAVAQGVLAAVSAFRHGDRRA